MRWMNILALLSVALMVTACFMPWVYIPTRDFMVTGIDAGEILHKPAYSHFVFCALYVILVLIPRIWAKRINLLVVALNTAWAVRNYYVVTTCAGGECPEKQAGIYLVIAGALAMLVCSFFPGIDVNKTTEKK